MVAVDGEVTDFEESTEHLFRRLAKIRVKERCIHCNGNGFPETCDEGASFHCLKCRKNFPVLERQRLERLAMERVPLLDVRDAPSDDIREKQQICRGVRVSWLKAFGQQHSHLGTQEVVERVICPATEESRCRYVELPSMASVVGRVDVFVLHTWGTDFIDTVSAIVHAVPDAAYVWLDIFAVRQWPGNTADLSFKCIARDTN
eukprot:8763394-Pyramimonas_sp.AAC.1